MVNSRFLLPLMLAISVASIGQENKEPRKAIDNWVRWYLEDKDYDRAITRASKILAGTEKVWGKDSPEIIVQLHDLMISYKEAGKFKESSDIQLRYNRIIVRQELKRSDDYLKSKLYTKSREISITALNLARRDLGADDPVQVDCLINIILASGKLNDSVAEDHYLQEAITVGDRLFGPEGKGMAVIHNLNGTAAFHQGRFRDAVIHLQRSLDIRTKAGEENTFAYAYNLQVLGQAYGALGQLDDCTKYLRASVATFTTKLGKEHESTKEAAKMLGSVLNYSGDSTDTAYSDTPSKNPSANRLVALMKAGRFEEALPDFRNFIKYFEGNPPSGMDQQLEAQIRMFYAVVLMRTGQKQEAARQLDRSLVIEERIFGTTNPFANDFFAKVAGLRLYLNDYIGADDLLNRCLESSHQAYGETNPIIAHLLLQKAQARIGLNDMDGGILLYTKAASSMRLTEEYLFPTMSETQRLNVHSRNRHVVYGLLSLTLERVSKHPNEATTAFQAWLDHKGAILDIERHLQGSVSSSKNPAVHAKALALRDARLALARLIQSNSEGMSPVAFKDEIRKLRDQKEQLEIELSKISQAFAVQESARRIDPPTLSQRLPAGSVYLDFARVPIFDFKKQEYTDTRYLAFLLRSGSNGTPEMLNLGSAEAIDKQVRGFQNALRRGEDGSSERENLYRLLITPLGTRLGSATQLVLSPDGLLHLLPFEVLGLKGRRMLMDQHSISYLASGLDVARSEIRVTASPEVIILANPDFDLAVKSSEPRRPPSRELKGLRFNALPGTGREADAIARLFPANNVNNLQGNMAQESVLKTLSAPRVLHIATHGYFLGSQDDLRMVPNRSPEAAVLQDEKSPSGPPTENPMLRSGLAFVGANAALLQGGDQGLLSAEKVLGLNLYGTDLVVLSACDTGFGKVESGEGVFGLKRAFIQAGVRNLVVSLWKVPDTQTKDLMVEFYRRLALGESKAVALIEAKRAMAKRHPNPFYWAAFILIGNGN